ncbi:hypothetical protein BKA70DRAFT_1408569, partial [Coprinopsis sp. MPI-PUGE-AT-0042]
GKKRNFVEAIELQTGPKNCETHDQFAGTSRLSTIPHQRVPLCILANVSCERPNKYEKLVKKLAKRTQQQGQWGSLDNQILVEECLCLGVAVDRVNVAGKQVFFNDFPGINYLVSLLRQS